MVIPSQPWSRDAAGNSPLRGYTARAKVLWWALVALGGYAVLQAAHDLLQTNGRSISLALLSLTLVGISAAFPIRLGNRQAAYSFGDFYLLLTLCAIGSSAATLAAALEGCVSGRASSKRLSSRIAAPAIQAMCMFAAGRAYESLANTPWFSQDQLPVAMATSVIGALVFGVGSTILVSAIPALNRKPHPDFLVAGAYVTSVVVTALVSSTIAFTFRDSLAIAMVTSVPLVAGIIAFLHLFRRHLQATLDSQRREAEAWKRSASETAEHVQALRVSEQRFQLAFRDAAVGAVLLKPDGTIVQVNGAMCRLLQRAEVSLIDTDLATYIAEQDRDAWRRHLRRAEGDASPQFSVELRFFRSDANILWLGVHCNAFTGPKTGLPGLVLHAHDNTARRKAEITLTRIANHDALTGLPNRRRFTEQLTESINAAHANPVRGVALMFVDFDGFKAINDTLGHAAGDQFLVEMAGRMSASIRPGDVVGRLGGDEFAILVRTSGVPDRADLASLANRILQDLAVPYLLSGTEVSASASIGIAADASHATGAEKAIQDADKAMYEAKAAGKRGFAFAPSA